MAQTVMRGGTGGPAALLGAPSATLAAETLVAVPWILGAHALLGLLIHLELGTARLHAIATLAVSLAAVLFKRRVHLALQCAAYIAGSEVLWRMSRAGLFWETGKYAVSAVLLLAMLRTRRRPPPQVPIAFFALLLPSIVLTLSAVEPDEARQLVSFNLSGPFTLMVAACFFSGLPLGRAQLERVLVAGIAPITTVATRVLLATLTAGDIQFVDDSNYDTSAGWGPNQVSAMLGLGAALSFLFVMNGYGNRAARGWLALAALWFATQSALTFSRGGLFGAIGAAVLAAAYGARERTRRQQLALFFAFATVAASLLVPEVNEFTGGALGRRLSSTNPTNRQLLLMADLRLWSQNFWVGVGPGMAKYERGLELGESAAHTEFSRLLAEHGVLGVFALGLLFWMAAGELRDQPSSEARSIVALCVGWSLLFMGHSAMRLAAPSLLFGVGRALLLHPETTPASRPRPLARSSA